MYNLPFLGDEGRKVLQANCFTVMTTNVSKQPEEQVHGRFTFANGSYYDWEKDTFGCDSEGKEHFLLTNIKNSKPFFMEVLPSFKIIMHYMNAPVLIEYYSGDKIAVSGRKHDRLHDRVNLFYNKDGLRIIKNIFSTSEGKAELEPSVNDPYVIIKVPHGIELVTAN